MRTTIDLPEELFRQVKARAALDGLKLKDLIRRYVEHGLREELPHTGAATTPRRARSPLPVIIPATGCTVPALSRAELATIDEEEDLAKHERSVGR